MKKQTLLAIICLLAIVFGCSKQKSSTGIKDEGKQVIKAPVDINQLGHQDQLFSGIRIVPLETTSDCLIGGIVTFKIHDDLVYVKSHFDNLFVFDLNGKYKYKIGVKGQGPGEYVEIRDFIFTPDGNIEILDFKKIETYTMQGKHIGTKRFDFLGDDFYCNPISFCQSPASGYYLWGGVPGTSDEKLREKSFMMHYVDNDIIVKKSYFPVINGDGGGLNRFKNYQDKILIDPLFADYNLYQIDRQGEVSIRYTIDFGKYSLFNKLSSPDEKIDQKTIDLKKYAIGLDNFIETDHWIHVGFTYNNLYYSLLYSKQSKESYYLCIAKASENELRFYPVSQAYEDKLVSINNASRLKIVNNN